MKTLPTIAPGARIALPCCPKATVIGIDLAKEGSDRSAYFRVHPDGRAEQITVSVFMAVPILGTIGEKEGSR